MKAERRHELKTNSLSKGLENAPAFFQQYGSRILLGVILCLLAFILVRNHLRDKEDKANNASKELGDALYSLNELRTIPLRTMGTRSMQGEPVSPEQIAAYRKEYSRDTESSVAAVIANSEDPKILSQAYIVRGDLNWELANFPTLPGSDQHPELKLDKPASDYLSEAAKAYNEVLTLNQDHQSVVAAKFSMANIAENRGEWDKAKDFFQQVADDASAGKVFQTWAKNAIEELKTLQKPPFMGVATAEVPPTRTPGKPAEFGPAIPANITTAPSIPSLPTTLPSLPGPTTAPSVVEPSFPVPATQPSISVPSSAPAVTLPPPTVFTPTTRPSQP